MNSIRGISVCEDRKSAVFDVPENFSPVIESFIEDDDVRFFSIELCEKLPELAESDQKRGFGGYKQRNNRNNGGGYGGYNNRNYGGGRGGYGGYNNRN